MLSPAWYMQYLDILTLGGPMLEWVSGGVLYVWVEDFVRYDTGGVYGYRPDPEGGEWR